MKTLLLCSYRPCDEGEKALGLERDSEGLNLIDRKILDLCGLGLEVVCVIAGEEAEEQLRVCKKIQQVELAFDSFPTRNLVTNIRSGLDVFEVPEACMILPVEIPVSTSAIWNFLRNEYGKEGFNTPFSVLQAEDQGAPWHLGFPLLLTRNGTALLWGNPEIENLLDARLQYLQRPFSLEPELAPLLKPL